jgi:hypothetical protein
MVVNKKSKQNDIEKFFLKSQLSKWSVMVLIMEAHLFFAGICLQLSSIIIPIALCINQTKNFLYNKK